MKERLLKIELKQQFEIYKYMYLTTKSEEESKRLLDLMKLYKKMYNYFIKE